MIRKLETCPDCRDDDALVADCGTCGGYGVRPCCERCGDVITGCSWSGKCLGCHEASLLPEDPWERAQDDLWEAEIRYA